MATDKIIEKGKKIAAHLMEASVEDVEFDRGTFRVAGTDKTIRLVDLVKRSFALAGWPAELGVGLEAVNGLCDVHIRILPSCGSVARPNLGPCPMLIPSWSTSWERSPKEALATN